MSEKRYFLHKRVGRDVIHDTLCHNWLEREELEEHMNVQYTKYSDLKKENENLKSRIKDYDVALKRLQDLTDKKLTENGQLAKEKERYKRLSEIRREEINNRILTIKEFIENCSDNKVKKILEDLFYSEVKEYDLSAQNRKLLHENEQLKQVVGEFVENQTQHNLWKLRTVLKGDVK